MQTLPFLGSAEQRSLPVKGGCPEKSKTIREHHWEKMFLTFFFIKAAGATRG